MTIASRAVLVVEDEPQIRRVLRTLLELEQFPRHRGRQRGARAAGGAHAQARSAHRRSGPAGSRRHEVITGVRSWSPVPIIVLSARSDESDKVAALEAGADDYVTKPFGARELAARVQVALRHSASAGAAGALLQIGAWSIDLKARSARDEGGRELHLTPTEYRLLEVLAQHIGLVVTHRALLQQVWGPGSAQQTHYLRVYMKQLRTKLEPDPARPRWLLTETGVGYRLAQRDQ